MRDRWRHIDQYKGFIGCYKIDLTLSLSTKMNIDAAEIYNHVIFGFNRSSTLIYALHLINFVKLLYYTVCKLNDKHDRRMRHDA